jgi:ankyrin repeat protein
MGLTSLHAHASSSLYDGTSPVDPQTTNKSEPNPPASSEMTFVWRNMCRAAMSNDTNSIVECINDLIGAVDGPEPSSSSSSSSSSPRSSNAAIQPCTARAAQHVHACLNWLCETPLQLSTATHVNMHVNMTGTPLIFASMCGSMLVCDQLISYGAEVDVCNDQGDTALMCASYFGQYEVVRCLLQRDANVNLFNHAGATALMCSVDRGHIKTMKLLVEMGHGSILTKDNDGNTALGIAKLNGYTEIAQYLELKSKKE